MGCDMCGSEKKLYVTLVEHTEMQLCDDCKIYGEVRRAIPTRKETQQEEKRKKRNEENNKEERATETITVLVRDYGRRIKQAREHLGRTQEELAKILGIKLSQLHKFECNHLAPDDQMAKKLEHKLEISLFDTMSQQRSQESDVRAEASGPLTIADIIKQAMKKK